MPERNGSPLKRFLTSKKLMKKRKSLHSIIASLIPMLILPMSTFKTPVFSTQNSQREPIMIDTRREILINFNINININKNHDIQ